jgi:hypothetical protein
MLSRSTTAGFFPLRLSPTFLLRLSALKDSTFLCFQAKVSTKLKILWILPRGRPRPTGPGATYRGGDLQEVWAMHHWVLVLLWARTFEEVTPQGSLDVKTGVG